jgi:hypothetical protein
MQRYVMLLVMRAGILKAASAAGHRAVNLERGLSCTGFIARVFRSYRLGLELRDEHTWLQTKNLIRAITAGKSMLG